MEYLLEEGTYTATPGGCGGCKGALHRRVLPCPAHMCHMQPFSSVLYRMPVPPPCTALYRLTPPLALLRAGPVLPVMSGSVLLLTSPALGARVACDVDVSAPFASEEEDDEDDDEDEDEDEVK